MQEGVIISVFCKALISFVQIHDMNTNASYANSNAKDE